VVNRATRNIQCGKQAQFRRERLQTNLLRSFDGFVHVSFASSSDLGDDFSGGYSSGYGGMKVGDNAMVVSRPRA
jgi:hypothetical protein